MLGGPDVAVSDLAAVNTEQESNGGKKSSKCALLPSSEGEWQDHIQCECWGSRRVCLLGVKLMPMLGR